MRNREKICHYSGIKQMDIMFGGGGGSASSSVCKPVVHLDLIQAKDHAKMRIREVRSRLKQKVCSCSLLHISFLSLLGNDEHADAEFECVDGYKCILVPILFKLLLG